MAHRADETTQPNAKQAKRGNPPAAPGKVSFHVYISATVKRAMRKWAKKQQRNLNVETERLLRAALEKEGMI